MNLVVIYLTGSRSVIKPSFCIGCSTATYTSISASSMVRQKQPPEVFYKIDVLKNFRNIHKKTLVLESHNSYFHCKTYG